MSNGYRDGTVLFGFALGASLCLNAFLWLPVGYKWFSENTRSHKYEYAAERCAQQHPEYALGSLPVLDGNEAQPAPAQQGQGEKGQDAPEGQQPDWCDLAAQQSMADSTVWIMVAALVGIVLTVVGVGLIWRTLFYTRETLKEAQSATEAALEAEQTTRKVGIFQLRAYVNIYKVRMLRFNPGEIFTVQCELRNDGQTPANNIRFAASIVPVPDPDNTPIYNVRPNEDRDRKGSIAPSGGDTIQISLSSVALRQELFDSTMNGECFITFAGYIFYDDIFGIRRRTIFRYFLKSESFATSGEKTVSEGRFSLSKKHNRIG